MIGHCRGCGAVKLGGCGDLCGRCLKATSEPLTGVFCQKCERPSVVVTDTTMDGRFYHVLLCKFVNCGAEITRELTERERRAL